ncbi:MAG: DEAD/DEAH box helicase [Thomasclavelia sp.]|nr:DEAD/DEAH box helicase [Thomasclavelia sp.]
MYIKQEEINKYFNANNWKKSHELYNAQAIQAVSVIKENNTYVIVGTISDNNSNHTANIHIDGGGNMVSFDCDCSNCKKNELACEHIGVLLLRFYGLEAKDIPYNYNLENNYLSKLKEITKRSKEKEINQKIIESKELIDNYRFQSIEENLKVDDNIHITPVIDTAFDQLFVSYKIGHEKGYVIKNLYTFVDNLKTGEIVSYGKNLNTNHDKECFDSSSKAIITFIEKNVHNLFDNKSIKIDRSNIDEFFLSHLRCLNINLNFTTIDLKNITLNLNKDEDYTTLSLNSLPGALFYGNKYIYYYENSVLNRYSKDFSKTVGPILTKLEYEDIIISNDDLSYFSKYIFDTIMPYVSIEGDSIDEYLPMDVSLEVYTKFNELNQLIVETEFKDTDGMTINNIEDYILSLKLDRILSILDDKLEYDEDEKMYYLNDEDEIYDFIFTTLPLINHDCEVYISENIKAMNRPTDLDFSLKVSLKNNLLEIDLNSVNVSKEEIRSIIKAYQSNKAFHRLKDGQFINLNDETLKDMTYLIDELHIKQSQLEEGTFYLDKANALYVNELIDNNKTLNFEEDNSFTDLIANVTNVSRKDYKVPTPYKKILRDYQVTGFKWLKSMADFNFGGILADDMGLGKTLQTIAYFESNLGDTNLVITPATLILNWRDEINKFSKDLKVLTIMGPVSKREEAINSIKDYDVVITSYDYIRKDFELYKDIEFDTFIIDEAQYIKNHATKNAKAVKRIKAKHRFALTGTPIENSLAELWSIFDFLMPNYLYSYSYFRDYYEKPIVIDLDEYKQEKLRQMVEPFILRRTKKEVLSELPEKIEDTIKISFNEEEEKNYISNLAVINNDLQKQLNISSKIDKIEILAMMTKLRQLCCDQRILYPGIIKPSSKMNVCMDIIKKAAINNQKVLLFSSFTTTLDLLEKQLRKEDISYYVLTGSTNKIKRHQLVNAFQKDDTTVFLISLKAGGTGLNLTSASVVIHFDPWWNLSSQNQATDRAYRIGQTNNVQVYKLIMSNSIEERIQDLQAKKQDLSNIFVENNDINISSMSNSDIIDLFKQ